MIDKKTKVIFIVLACILNFVEIGLAQETNKEKHIMVAMRMVGHELLLSSGDSLSRVLPIEKVEDSYTLRFESSFVVDPEKLTQIVKQVFKESSITEAYIVEVENCETEEVLYSFEVENLYKSDIIPCKTRPLPESCYIIKVSFLSNNDAIGALSSSTPFISDKTLPDSNKSDYWNVVLLLLSVGLLIGMGLYIRRKKLRPIDKLNIISLGEYRFDKRNMELSFKNEKIELSSKEADLLFLLHSSANTTLERELILRIVWGDEGDYVGRTLDVFISKLRKKLEADSSIRIVNIRGIGYKLIMND